MDNYPQMKRLQPVSKLLNYQWHQRKVIYSGSRWCDESRAPRHCEPRVVFQFTCCHNIIVSHNIVIFSIGHA